MYVLLKHPNFQLLSMISRQDLNFPSMIIKGYEVVYENTRASCEKMMEQMTKAMCDSFTDKLDTWFLQPRVL